MTRRSYFALLAVLLSLAIAPQAQSTRFITEQDLLKFTWIADPQLSPDGSSVAFVRVTVNEKENRYETSLFAVASSGSEAPRRLTSGVRDTSPRWAPDGKQLAFVRAVEKDGKAQPAQIYLLDTTGGEARPITSLPRGPGRLCGHRTGSRWHSPRQVGRKAGGQDGQDGKNKSDVKVITRAVYRANGTPGYVDTEHHSHIFTIAPVDLAEPLTASTHGRRIRRTRAGVVARRLDDLFRVDARGGAVLREQRRRVVQRAERRRRNREDRRHRRGHRQPLGVAGRTPHRVRRHTPRKPIRSYSQPDLWISDLAPGSVPGISPRRTTSTSPAASAAISRRHADRTANRSCGRLMEPR
jgi:hypothetical protein